MAVGGFANVGAMWEILIKGLRIGNKSARRRLPRNAKLLEHSMKHLGIDDDGVGGGGAGVRSGLGGRAGMIRVTTALHRARCVRIPGYNVRI